MSAERIGVRKTYKLAIGGAFPRSESGRTYVVTDTSGQFLANVACASRKDVRDAVVAARRAQPGWAAATPYNRGQVLYRAAEMVEGRRDQFVDLVSLGETTTAEAAGRVVDLTVDRLVWYAGWADKVAQVAGAVNPVAGPYFTFSVPQPSGVVGVVAPQESSLLGFVSVVAAVVVTGNTAVVLASEAHPLPAVTLAETLATSDVPGGVVNVLTGRLTDTLPTLAAHRAVDGRDLRGAPPDRATSAEHAPADHVTRVLRPSAGDPGWSEVPTPKRMLSFVETKTVWHPMGI